MRLWLTLTKGVAAIFAAALFLLGVAPASAAEWKPNEDDSLILELRSGSYRLGETLRGYQKSDGVCVDLADVIQAMDLPIRLDRKSRRATGWIFAESQTLVIDRDSSTVQIMNKAAPIGDADLVDTPEGWCADTRALSRWLGMTFKIDLSNLAVVLESDRPLPFLQAIERKSRAARLRPAASDFDLSQLQRADMPYKPWRTPSIDVVINAGMQSGHGESDRSLRYEIYASGEVLGASVDARFASDDEGMPDSLRVRAYRFDPEGTLLGPLQATQVAVGDVESFAGALTGQSAVGRGFFVSNRPLSRPSRFSTTTLRGEMPAGWDAELYVNGQLMAFQSDRSDGRYEFPDVELRFGNNALEVVLYGPQGQIRRERTDIPVGPASIPAGKTWYWAGALEKGRDLIDFHRAVSDPLTGWRWGVGVERGIDKRTSVGAGLQSLVLDGRRHTYAELTATRAVGPMLVELSGAQQFGPTSGQALSGNALGRVGRVNVKAEVLWINGGYESEIVTEREKRAYGLTLDTDVFVGGMRVPVSIGGRRTIARDGTIADEWLMRGSLMMRGLAATAELANRKSDGPSASPTEDGTELRLLANTSLGRVRLRGNARYRLSGLQRGFEAVSLDGDMDLTPRSNLRGSAEYLETNNELTFGAGYSRQFKDFAIRGDGTLSTRGRFGLALSLAMSFGSDPVEGGLRISGQKLAQYGHAAVTVFRDENGDGLREAGEEPIEGIEIVTPSALEQEKTNKAGRAVVDGLRPFAPVLVRIDESSIGDPLLQPKTKGMVVVPRPGVGTEIMLPLAPTGEMEGTLLGADGEARAGVTLELADARGQAMARTVTEYDGYFLFDKVPYGAYRLRIGAASAKALGDGVAVDLSVCLDRAHPTIRAGAVRVGALRTQVASGAP
jgi:hypothetical protein